MKSLNILCMVIALFMGPFTVPVSANSGADCPGCQASRQLLVTETSNEVRFRSLLAANQKFIEGPGGKDPSKAIKVKSNILVLLLKIDTSKNEITNLESQIKAKCGGCP